MNPYGPPAPSKTPAQIRQDIADQIRALDQREAWIRSRYFVDMETIRRERDMLEDMWRKTYETD